MIRPLGVPALVLCPQCSGDGCPRCDDLGYVTRDDADAMRARYETDRRDLHARALTLKAAALGVEVS